MIWMHTVEENSIVSFACCSVTCCCSLLSVRVTDCTDCTKRGNPHFHVCFSERTASVLCIDVLYDTLYSFVLDLHFLFIFSDIFSLIHESHRDFCFKCSWCKMRRLFNWLIMCCVPASIFIFNLQCPEGLVWRFFLEWWGMLFHVPVTSLTRNGLKLVYVYLPTEELLCTIYLAHAVTLISIRSRFVFCCLCLS